MGTKLMLFRLREIPVRAPFIIREAAIAEAALGKRYSIRVNSCPFVVPSLYLRSSAVQAFDSRLEVFSQVQPRV
jgi:hypothetical protein